jgi:hypothetical protein
VTTQLSDVALSNQLPWKRKSGVLPVELVSVPNGS